MASLLSVHRISGDRPLLAQSDKSCDRFDLLGLFYFTSRRHRPATASETAFATLWLWFRRILCFGTAPLLGAGAIAMLFDPPSPDSTFTNVALPLLTALIALFVAYVGVVGCGPRQLDWKDDIELHRENKRRYKWRW